MTDKPKTEEEQATPTADEEEVINRPDGMNPHITPVTEE